MFHNHLEYLAKNGYEYEESSKNQAIKEQQELLMKMLAVSKINMLEKLKLHFSIDWIS